MRRIEVLAKGVRRGAALVLLYFAALIIWRFATTGGIAGLDLIGGAVGLIVYSLALSISEARKGA